MLYSKQLLSSRTHTPSDYQIIKEQLIAKVFEIEHGEIQRDLPELLVVGKVTHVIKHPNADTLFVCQVNCWDHGMFQICTWWENVADGQYVPVALPWCTLPSIGLTIGRRSMRWEESNGMICSKGELGIKEDEDKHWIWDMTNDCTCDESMIGKAMKEVFPWMENTVFEVESVAITNRPDLWWHIGVAAEYQTACRSENNSWVSKIQECINNNHLFSQESIKQLPVFNTQSPWCSIQTNKCVYYSLTSLNKVSCEPSVFPWRVTLLDLGHIPKLNWIDYSNYFMSLTWQPIHCFDQSLIRWPISVQEAAWWELFVDLFGKEYTLAQGDIIICDQEGILALAGIIGWTRAEVSSSTQSILIEIAHFDPLQIRKTATRLGIKTEAAIRYEKWINPLWTAYCTTLWYELLTENNHTHHTWAVDSINIVINDPSLFEQPTLLLDLQKASEYIRWAYTPSLHQEFLTIMEKLGYQIQESNGNICKVLPPLRRSDITMVEDIYEDLARHSWLEHIPEIPAPVYPSMQKIHPTEINHTLCKAIIERLWFTQIETYPWYSKTWVDLLSWIQTDHQELLNPTDTTTPFMRQSIIPGLLQIAQKNHRITLPLKIIEVGKVYLSDNSWSIQQPSTITWLIITKKSDDRKQDVYLGIKEVVECITDIAHLPWYQLDPTNHSFFHPTKQASISINNQVVWLIWQVHPSVLDIIWIQDECVVGVVEINTHLLFQQISQHSSAHTPWSYLSNQDQLITRDLSFEIGADQSFDQIITYFSHNTRIHSYEVVDLYQAPWSDKKSIAIRFTIHWDGALTLEWINAIMDTLIDEVKHTGATLKGGR